MIRVLPLCLLLCLQYQNVYASGASRPVKVKFSKAITKQRSVWAVGLFEKYRARSSAYNQDFFVFVDYKSHVSKHRFYIVTPKKDKALVYKVAHGYGSDKNKDGYVERVGNKRFSYMSSEGVFITRQGLRHSDKFGYTVHLCGLSRSNSQASRRLLRVHPAKTKKGDDYLLKHKPSAGCFALNIKIASGVMKKLAKKPTVIIATLTDLFK